MTTSKNNKIKKSRPLVTLFTKEFLKPEMSQTNTDKQVMIENQSEILLKELIGSDQIFFDKNFDI